MRRLGIVLVAVALFAFAGTAAGDTNDSSSSLLVATVPAANATLVALTWDEDAPMANLELDIPAGYSLDVGQPVGTAVADAIVLTKDLSIADGTLTVADSATTSTCDPQTHVAVWTMSVSDVGPAITVPWFVDSSPTGGYVVHACFQASAFGAAATPIGSLLLNFIDGPLHAPAAPGRYLWHALVTPFGSDGQIAETAPAADLQASVPLPASLTMKATYNARTRFATLKGRLMLAGQPAANYPIDFAVGAAANDLPTDFGSAETAADGTFVRRVKLVKSAFVFAVPGQPLLSCTSALAPVCVSTEYALVEATAHVIVPKPAKPKHKKKR